MNQVIRIEMTIDELDYDSLFDRYLPAIAEKLRETGNPVGMLLSNGMPASMAKGIVAGLPRSAKDRLAADLLNANGEKFCQKMEELAAGKGVHVCVSAVHAEVK